MILIVLMRDGGRLVGVGRSIDRIGRLDEGEEEVVVRWECRRRRSRGCYLDFSISYGY